MIRGTTTGGRTTAGAVALLLTVVVWLTSGVTAAVAQDGPSPVDLGAYQGPLRFEAAPGTTLRIGDTNYVGTLETRVGPGGGMVVLNELSMDAYVEGLAEMPASWHMEALRAQAIAARTYAWYQMELGTFERRGLGYDICDSVACQVFAGRDVVEAPEVGHRWAEAVRSTTGQVLTYEGEPILARFFSTSGGHTFDNEDVFASEGPRPYLKGRPDPDDALSPYHRWQVRFTRDQFDRIIGRGETLGAASPVGRVDRLERAGGEPDLIRVTGKNGVQRSVTAVQFRSFVSDVAPALYPEQYPGSSLDGERTLPATVPSSRFEVRLGSTEVIIDGSGWGHGVGLGQYGARGKAERGLAAAEILAFYYNGLEPTTPDDLPTSVRVGLDDDTGAVEIGADGPFRVVAGDTVLTERGLGTWRVRARGDRSMGLVAPAGYGAPLVVAPAEVSRPQPLAVERITVETVVNKTTELALEVTGPDGEPILTRRLGVVDAGRASATWALDDDDGDAVPPGDHQVRLVATDETGRAAGQPVPVTIQPVAAEEPPPSLLEPATARVGSSRGLIVYLALAGALLGLVIGVVVPRSYRARSGAGV